ncbi:LysR family transcriptional regulator [Bacillus sp. Marseille-P3661]|uniref:LysR family transcriptional regulator n=1 Tax=Bacillus sp. Marseille-P3661 TaxID=1936234 RepID=UPI0015E183AC|nr:LysR family transcriptional regulator [Bacillus sp. Marseille-P3661]
MTFDQILTFVSVATTNSFTKTSQELHLSQPSVTSRIKNLEETLGVTLFDRDNKKLSLTKDGEILLNYSNQIIDLYSKLLTDLNKASNEVTIGATPTIGIYIVPELVEKLLVLNSSYTFDLKHGSSAQLLTMILDGKIDLGFVIEKIDHPDVYHFEIRESLKVKLVASAGHPILKEEKISLEMLQSYKIVKLDNMGLFWEQINDQLKQINMKTLIKVDHPETAKNIMHNTTSLAFMPNAVIEKELKDGSIKTINIDGILPYDFPIYLLYHKRQESIPKFKQLLKLFKEIV